MKNVPAIDLNPESVLVNTPFFQWLNSQNQPPAIFQSAVVDYLDFKIGTDKLTSSEYNCLNLIFKHFWWKRHRSLID